MVKEQLFASLCIESMEDEHIIFPLSVLFSEIRKHGRYQYTEYIYHAKFSQPRVKPNISHRLLRIKRNVLPQALKPKEISEIVFRDTEPTRNAVCLTILRCQHRSQTSWKSDEVVRL